MTSVCFGCLSDPQAEVGLWYWPPTKLFLKKKKKKHLDVVYTDGFPSVDRTSLSKSGKLNSGSHCRLSSEILSRAYIISGINRLKVFNSDDTLGDSCGVPQSSVDQSPGILNGHGPFVLFKDGTQTDATGTGCFAGLPSTQPILEYKAHAH